MYTILTLLVALLPFGFDALTVERSQSKRATYAYDAGGLYPRGKSFGDGLKVVDTVKTWQPLPAGGVIPDTLLIFGREGSHGTAARTWYTVLDSVFEFYGGDKKDTLLIVRRD